MLLQSTSLYKKLQKRYSRRINLDLNRINKVLYKFNNPHLSLVNPINILGSDGKMSVLTSLKYFLESGKKNTTAFTSPHLYDFRHRIWLKDNYISIKKIKTLIKLIEKKKLKLTLFELLTCVYILAAKELKNISYNLVESGLLFKKDSTNLWLNPKAQIVTNINFQHQDWVKPKTLKEICRQKVGSLSKNTTIYISKQKTKTLRIIKKILNNNPSKIIYPSHWRIKNVKDIYYYIDKTNKILIKNKHIKSKALVENLGLAIKVALDLGVSKKTIINTIPKIKFEGRVQYIKKGNLINVIHKNEKLLVDGCHSIESAKNLHNYLNTLNLPIYGILGMKKNKLPEKFIKVFKNSIKKIYTVNIPNEPNSIQASKLKLICENQNFDAEISKSVTDALKKISNKKKKIIIIFGSLYLVGDVLKKN